MSRRVLIYCVYLVLAALVLIACQILGSPGQQDSTPVPTPDLVATEVAVQKAALATLTAQAPSPPSPTSTSTPPVTPTGSTILPTNTPLSPTSTPVAEIPALCTINANVNLRNGPGTAYAPPIGSIPAGTQVTPLAYSPTGYPEGSWLQVQVGGQSGWVSAQSQFISCPIDLATLPQAVVPPPPVVVVQPSPLPTRPVYEVLPVDGNAGNQTLRGKEPLNNSRYVVLPGYMPGNIDREDPAFRDKLVFQVEVFDPAVGTHDGAGIQEVQFTIINRDQDDEPVYYRPERTPHYCAFGGGEPNCDVFVFAEHNYHWPDNGPALENAHYRAVIKIIPHQGDSATWNWDFEIQDAPSTQPPQTDEIKVEIVQIGLGSLDTTVTNDLVFQVRAYHTGYGSHDGAGIDYLDMSIFDSQGQVVRYKREINPSYCAFGGGDPDCSRLPFDQIEPGAYTLQAIVYAKDGQSKAVEIEIEIQ